MKIKKLKNYQTPVYPNMKEMAKTPEIMNKLPRRWQVPSKWMMIVGISSLLTRYMSAEDVDTMSSSIVAFPNTGKLKQVGKEIKVEQNDKISFANILPEALAEDGRGAFGCMATNPPTFLSESEALELIHGELLKAGLKLKEDVKINGIKVKNPKKRYSRKKDIPDNIIGEYRFDYTSEDESIIIEFLSKKDHDDFDASNMMCTVSSFDFPALTQKMKNSFEKYNGKEATVGIFFDPLVSRNEGSSRFSWINTQGIKDKDLINFMREEYTKKSVTSTLPQEKAKEKLREQVAYFVEQLRASNKLPKIEEKK